MEKDTLRQKLDIASGRFSVGDRVCNYKVGSVGTVTGEPFADIRSQRVFVPVSYGERECLEDVEFILPVNAVKKGMHRNT